MAWENVKRESSWVRGVDGKTERVHFRRELYEFVVVSATVKGQY